MTTANHDLGYLIPDTCHCLPQRTPWMCVESVWTINTYYQQSLCLPFTYSQYWFLLFGCVLLWFVHQSQQNFQTLTNILQFLFIFFWLTLDIWIVRMYYSKIFSLTEIYMFKFFRYTWSLNYIWPIYQYWFISTRLHHKNISYLRYFHI